jgi:hypothetical protein
MWSVWLKVAAASIRLVAAVLKRIGHVFWETSLFFSRTAEGLAWVGIEFNYHAWRLYGYAYDLDAPRRRRQQ